MLPMVIYGTHGPFPARVPVIGVYYRNSLKVYRSSSDYTPLFQDLRSLLAAELRLSALIPGTRLRFIVPVQAIRLYFRYSDHYCLPSYGYRLQYRELINNFPTSSSYTNFLPYKSVNSRPGTTIILLRSPDHRKKLWYQPELSSL